MKILDYHFIGSLDDICYLLNIRANDVQCNSVVISFLLVSNDDCILYVDKDKLTDKVKKHLEDSGVSIKDYELVNKDIAKLFQRKLPI